MSKLSILEESGAIPAKGEQPRNHSIGNKAGPTYEFGQPDEYFDDDLETVRFEQVVSGAQTGPEVIVSPLQYFSQFKPQTFTPFSRSSLGTWNGTSATGDRQILYNVPTRKYCVITSFELSLMYRPDVGQTNYFEKLSTGGLYFSFDLVSQNTRFLDSNNNLVFGTGSGFVDLNENVLDFGGVNSSLVFKEREQIIFTFDIKGQSSTNVVPPSVPTTVIVRPVISGFLVSSEDYETLLQMGRRPSQLDFNPGITGGPRKPVTFTRKSPPDSVKSLRRPQGVRTLKKR